MYFAKAVWAQKSLWKHKNWSKTHWNNRFPLFRQVILTRNRDSFARWDIRDHLSELRKILFLWRIIPERGEKTFKTWLLSVKPPKIQISRFNRHQKSRIRQRGLFEANYIPTELTNFGSGSFFSAFKYVFAQNFKDFAQLQAISEISLRKWGELSVAKSQYRRWWVRGIPCPHRHPHL